MDKGLARRLLRIAGAGLIIAGAIFLILCIAGERNSWLLCAALVCTVLSNLFSLVRTQLFEKGEE